MAAQRHFACFLFPETVVREDGAGYAVELADAQGQALEITLGITRIQEQESLDLSVWGSPDGSDWGARPLFAFPQKFYCATYSVPLDLTARPEVRFLRVQWKMNRWGRGDPKPLFGFYVFAEQTADVFAAHSAYGMSGRGAWWVMTPEQLTAKKGEAATLSDAANRCIAAPYMANAGKPLSPEDAEALTVYLTSIYDAQAKDSAPFLIAKALSVPPGGLTPDKTNGQRIYDTSCSQCHGVVDTVPRLEEKKFELNVVQIMAKVRGLADWETTYKTANYSVGQEPSGGPVTWLLYGMRAYAQEGAPPEAAPPAANPPAGGEGAAPGPSGAGGEAEAASPFAENSMPWYATDILSDQDVVDVAFYIFQDLGAPEPAPTPAK